MNATDTARRVRSATDAARVDVRTGCVPGDGPTQPLRCRARVSCVTIPGGAARNTGVHEQKKDMIKVLVVEDHPLILEGVRSVVAQEASLRLLVAATTGESAMDALERECIDVALVDSSLPDIETVALIGRVSARCPRAKVIVLCADESRDPQAFFNAGAHCVLSKPRTTPATLADCLSRCPRAGCSEKTQARAEIAIGGLSARELQVVRLVAHGRSNKEIGAALGIADRTVETYRLRIGRKLGLTGAAALTRWAIENGVGGSAESE